MPDEDGTVLVGEPAPQSHRIFQFKQRSLKMVLVGDGGSDPVDLMLGKGCDLLLDCPIVGSTVHSLYCVHCVQ